MFVDLDPALRALRIGAAIGRPDFAVMRRLLPDLRNGDAGDELRDLPVLDGAGRAADDEAAQPLRLPGRVVERREAAAGDAKQMEFVELQMLDQRMQIRGDRARLRSERRIGRALAPAAPIERDDAIAGEDKARDLRLPDLDRAGIWVQQDNRHAGTAGIDEP